MGKGMSSSFGQGGTIPHVCGEHAVIHLLEALYELTLLLLKHLDVAFRIDLVVGLLPLSDKAISAWTGFQTVESTYPKTQMALSAVQREQGLAPSHLLFFRRHRSQALHTRFRMASASDPDDDVRSG